MYLQLQDPSLSLTVGVVVQGVQRSLATKEVVLPAWVRSTASGHSVIGITPVTHHRPLVGAGDKIREVIAALLLQVHYVAFDLFTAKWQVRLSAIFAISTGSACDSTILQDCCAKICSK